jgi:4-hydroxybenzoate polyprenyltransferase
MSAPQFPSDALSTSWVNRAPATWQPFLQLARLDRPIGIWLLYWPCVWGVLLAQANSAKGPDLLQAVFLLALFFIGSVVMRGAGCAYNDIIDRDIDAQVTRTAGRPLPSKRVSVRAAWIFVVVLCGIGLLVLIQLNPAAIFVALGSIILVAAYPFMKRITWWPQAWLGCTFNWGALVGYASVADEITLPAVLLYCAGIFWTLGYDSIYAYQDIEDDALVGVKSSARALGTKHAKPAIGVFYGLSIIFLITSIILATGYFWLGLLALPAAGHFALQIKQLDVENSARCLALFRSNRDCGGLIATALAMLLLI